MPLVKVLRMVDSDEKPAMGFIYEAMVQAKNSIKDNFNNLERSYKPVLDIIDKRWENQLQHPLHAAAYYLNPQFQYSPNFQAGVDIKIGLYNCLEHMVPDAQERTKIDLQLDTFKNARGLFGRPTAVMTRNKKSPADWWDSYGDECPELKRFVVRILSLTCASSGCERNWSAFEMVHTKKRNRLHQQKMNDLVFVMYNLKLKRRQERRERLSITRQPIILDDLSSDDEWIAEAEEPVLPSDGTWLADLDRTARRIAREATRSEGEIPEDVEIQVLSDDDVETTNIASNEIGLDEFSDEDNEVGEDDIQMGTTTGSEDMVDCNFGFDD